MKNTKAIFFVLLLSLLGNFSALDWQGYGNMSSSNLTDIWTFVNNNIGYAVTNSKHQEFTTNLSNYLNKLWDPAWNVFVIQTTVSKDTVVYGYAFRDHWMWYNGYVINNAFLSFVIWKDYNCQGWIEPGSSLTFTSTENAAIIKLSNSFQASADRADIWGTAKKFMNSLVAQTAFSGPDKAYSLIMTQARSIEISSFTGRICLMGNKYYRNTMTFKDNLNALVFLFQTR